MRAEPETTKRNPAPLSVIAPSVLVEYRARHVDEAGDDEHLARADLCEDTAQLLAVGLRSAGRFSKHLLCPGRAQLLHLRVNTLAVRRYPCIAIFHDGIMQRIYAAKKPFVFSGLILLRNC